MSFLSLFYKILLLFLLSPLDVLGGKPAKGSHYETLGLDDDKASEKEIKKGYRNMALKWHPDKHSEGEARDAATKKFQEISQAYEILSDEKARRQYDLGGGGPHMGGGGGFGGGDPFSGFQGRDPFDMFKDAFGTDDPFSDMVKEMMGNMMGGGFAGGFPAGGAGSRSGARKSKKKGSSGGNPMEDMLKNMMGGMAGGGGGGGGSSSFTTSFSSSSSSFGGGSGGGMSTSTQTVIKNGQRVTRTVSRGPDGKETVEESINGEPVGGGQGMLDGSSAAPKKQKKSQRRRGGDQQWGF
jgi:curved DNA-binding protein CbpA